VEKKKRKYFKILKNLLKISNLQISIQYPINNLNNEIEKERTNKTHTKSEEK
jgi:hypothetical protein